MALTKLSADHFGELASETFVQAINFLIKQESNQPTPASSLNNRIRSIKSLTQETIANESTFRNAKVDQEYIVLSMAEDVAKQLVRYMKDNCGPCLSCNYKKVKVEHLYDPMRMDVRIQSTVYCNQSLCPDQVPASVGEATGMFRKSVTDSTVILPGGGGTAGVTGRTFDRWWMDEAEHNPDGSTTQHATKDGKTVEIRSVTVPFEADPDKPATASPDAW